MSLTIRCKYKYFDSTVQRAEDRQQKFYFCRLPFAVNVKLKGPLKYLLMPLLGKNQLAITLHMYTSIGPNLDNTHRGQI